MKAGYAGKVRWESRGPPADSFIPPRMPLHRRRRDLLEALSNVEPQRVQAVCGLRPASSCITKIEHSKNARKAIHAPESCDNFHPPKISIDRSPPAAYKGESSAVESL
jgi:hypothetical protein